jgi:hypothetical protein
VVARPPPPDTADARGQLLKDIARLAKEASVAFKSRRELEEDLSCISSVVDALRDKKAGVEVRVGRGVGVWGVCVCVCVVVARDGSFIEGLPVAPGGLFLWQRGPCRGAG